jgi:sec-independent protein translocase protein TatA
MVSKALRPGSAASRCYSLSVPFGLQLWEVFVVLLIVLLVFGPKRLPEMGRSLGRGMREFKDSITGRDDERQPRDDERQPELPPAQEEPPVPAGTRRDESASS